MSNSADFESLARELRALRHPDETGRPDGPQNGGPEEQRDEAMLVLRLVRGLTPDHWQNFCRAYPHSRWCALPLDKGVFPSLADMRLDAPRLADALAAEVFSAQLSRELLRLARNGGELTLMFAALCERESLRERLGEALLLKLETLLHETLLGCLEACDSLGTPGPGHLAVLLPGVGLLRSRLLAEKLQTTFSAQARVLTRTTDPALTPQCAFSIACADQGGKNSPQALLAQAESGLQDARNQREIKISQTSQLALDERATLVHSSEKRFLFFGGD